MTPEERKAEAREWAHGLCFDCTSPTGNSPRTFSQEELANELAAFAAHRESRGAQGPSLDDYMNAPSGIGPLAAEWKDKPHRLVYDLVKRLEATQPQQSAAPPAEELARRIAKEIELGAFGDNWNKEHYNISKAEAIILTSLSAEPSEADPNKGGEGRGQIGGRG